MVNSASHPATTIDVLATARDRPDARLDLLQAQLNRALDALIVARLADHAGDLAARRGVLFDLYDEQIVTKAQVRQRGELAPDEFHERLRDHRLATPRGD